MPSPEIPPLTKPPSDRKLLAEEFAAWLGPDLYDPRFSKQYRAAFDSVERNAFGELPGSWTVIDRLRHLPVRWERFTAIADGAVRRWTAAHRVASVTRQAAWAEASGGRNSLLLANVSRAAMRPRVKVNSASAAELATVPGIGPAVGRRIVVERARAGVIGAIDELAGVDGFSKDARSRAVTFLDFTLSGEPVALTTTSLQQFGETPSFPEYVRHLLDTGLDHVGSPGTWRPLDRTSATPAGLAARQLAAVAEDVAAEAFWPARRRVDVPDMERATRANRRANTIHAKQFADDVAGVGVVRNAAYLDLVLELIEASRQRAWVEVFFFTSAAGGPGEQLLAALAGARGRGVDTRLIVDTDLVEDVHQANRINEQSLKRLRASKIPFRLDPAGTTSHGKTLVVDDSQLITGTHNWTTRAIFELDETSLYLESTTLAARAAERFAQLWRAYNPNAKRRSVDLALLRFPSPAEHRTLAAAGLGDSRALLREAATKRRARPLARRLGLDPDRLERLWSLLALAQELMLPEPTAWALSEAGFSTPAAVRGAGAHRLRAAVREVGPLRDPYSGCPVRLDVVEALRG
jgi:hypothetical protein